jgi:hypothetical protein
MLMSWADGDEVAALPLRHIIEMLGNRSRVQKGEMLAGM